MGWALTALLLIRVDARAGEWVFIDDTARHLACDAEQLRRAATALFAAHQVEAEVSDGQVLAVRVAPRVLHPGEAA